MASRTGKQKAGSNSRQDQYFIETLNVGITEERAKIIANDIAIKAIEEYALESEAIVKERLTKQDDIIIKRLKRIENGFEKFADPSIQKLLWQAHIAAAASEREADYDILAELLAYRIEKGEPRHFRAAIHGAVKVVDEIDSQALCGLTTIFTFQNVIPNHGTCSTGLKFLNDVCDSIGVDDLPKDYFWISHLDSLGVIRRSETKSFIKVEKYLTAQLDGYFDAGIKEGTPEYKKAVGSIASASLPKDTLVDNEFLPGYLRIPISTRSNIDKLGVLKTKIGVEGAKHPLSIDQKNAINTILKLYTNYYGAQYQVNKAFWGYWNSMKSLKRMSDWWDHLPHSFEFTPIGEVLAYTNAKRLIPEFPNIDLFT